MFKVPRSPFVAMSQVAATAKMTAASSRSLGARRAFRQAISSTNTLASICNTVAVPAFVMPVETAYVDWLPNSPMPNRQVSATYVGFASSAFSCAR